MNALKVYVDVCVSGVSVSVCYTYLVYQCVYVCSDLKYLY